MDKQKIHYCFTLSDAQMEYLRCKKYKIDRMECFMSPKRKVVTNY